ncbi:hypothetical protein V7S43_007622 [Phytophthora oleae]|uniref:Uncharacterized protein n=1 Tax=Phytophthora oleae TaxID=2107226 RepID=A0ABD3FM44_9STRA
MKQLKMDGFLVRGSDPHENRLGRIETQHSVLQAFAEYVDVLQNVFVSRPRQEVEYQIEYCRCERRADWHLTCLSRCENRAVRNLFSFTRSVVDVNESVVAGVVCTVKWSVS